MIGRHLALFQIQELFGIDLGIFLRLRAAAVADGDEGKAKLVKAAQSEIRNVPSQHTVADLVILVALCLPFLRGKLAERRQIAFVRLAHCLQLLQRLVDLRTFHRFLHSFRGTRGACGAASVMSLFYSPSAQRSSKIYAPSEAGTESVTASAFCRHDGLNCAQTSR